MINQIDGSWDAAAAKNVIFQEFPSMYVYFTYVEMHSALFILRC